VNVVFYEVATKVERQIFYFGIINFHIFVI